LKVNRGKQRQRTQDPGRTEAVRPWICGALFVCVLAVTGCTTIQKILPTADWGQARVRNEGYSLLYKLMDQESDVSKILIIKHASSPVADVIKEIASTCGFAKKGLDLFHEKDNLNLKMADLPEIEQKTRLAIASTDTKQLLTSSGKTFEHRLLLTQVEAMNYASHMAKVLHDQETDPLRKQFLATLSQHCATLHDKVIDLLK
jgi:hypothetical protein